MDEPTQVLAIIGHPDAGATELTGNILALDSSSTPIFDEVQRDLEMIWDHPTGVDW